MHPDTEGTLEAARAEARAVDPKSLSLCARRDTRSRTRSVESAADEALQRLVAIEVMPDPPVRCLRMWLACRAELDEEERLQVMARLAAARGFLREGSELFDDYVAAVG